MFSLVPAGSKSSKAYQGQGIVKAGMIETMGGKTQFLFHFFGTEMLPEVTHLFISYFFTESLGTDINLCIFPLELSLTVQWGLNLNNLG